MVGFIKVRLFKDLYGNDVNGLQLTIAQVITFLNICELAYSLAFRQLLYKPLAENDHETVKKIYYGARKIFRITGVIVLFFSVIVAILFPFFSESPFNYWQTFGTVLLLALPYGISYFLMGPNFVIMADQKEYKTNIWIQSFSILRMLLMVVAILLKQPFIWILIIEGVNILASNTLARYIALKEYPWLKEEVQDKNDKSFQKKAKFAIIQRLSELATTQTDNIVISGFMGYTMSSVYGNYSYLTDNIGKITQTMVQSPMNSFGNLFNDKHADSYGVFTEFFNFATYISTIVATVIFIIMPEFVQVWMRDPLYDVSLLICLFFALNIFYMTIRQPVIIVRDANGLYVNAKNNAWLLAVVKIVLSIVLIQNLGLLGVVLATTISYWTVDYLYNPKLVYKEVFHRPVKDYFFMVFSRLAIAVVIGFTGYLLWNRFFAATAVQSILYLGICAIAIGIYCLVTTTVIYFISYRSFRSLLTRIKNLLENRKKRK